MNSDSERCNSTARLRGTFDALGAPRNFCPQLPRHRSATGLCHLCPEAHLAIGLQQDTQGYSSSFNVLRGLKGQQYLLEKGIHWSALWGIMQTTIHVSLLCGFGGLL